MISNKLPRVLGPRYQESLMNNLHSLLAVKGLQQTDKYSSCQVQSVSIKLCQVYVGSESCRVSTQFATTQEEENLTLLDSGFDLETETFLCIVQRELLTPSDGLHMQNILYVGSLKSWYFCDNFIN